MRLLLISFFTLFSVLCNFVFSQANLDVVINELMASNKEAVADEAGDFDDWIELYNNLDIPMDISGYGLSDDIEELGKFILPENTVIVENGYLIIWADDDQEQGPLHAQFKLSASGENVFLTDTNGNIVDEIEFPELGEDQTYARDPNGTGEFRVKEHSFGDNNDSTTSTLNPLPASITFSPNPTKDFMIVRGLESDGGTKVQVYNMNGSLVAEQASFDQSITIDLRAIPAGNLVVKIDAYEAILVQKID